jgi:hypothetical protein
MATTSHTTPALTSSDNGKQYRAVWTNPAGQTVSQAASVTVSVPPAVTTHPSNTTVVSGQTATFSAAASGSPTPTVQWQRSTNGGSTWSNIGGATGTSYSFTTALSDSGYQYRAVFTNSAGFVNTNAATLTVATVPAVTSHPSSQTVTAGASATFSASGSGSPTPSVQWQVSTNGGSSWGNIGGATSTTYSFTTAAGNNGYQYRAVFTNAAGSATTNAAVLTVQYAPEVTADPESSLAVAGEAFTLSASATGSPAPSVQWQSSSDSQAWTNIAGATSASLAVTASATNTFYRALFTNAVGSTPSAAAALATQPAAASGGTEFYTSSGGRYYKVHKFTNVGSNTFNVTQAGGIEYLMVAAGGAGQVTPGSSTSYRGGGGAGGFLEGVSVVTTGQHAAVVGAGRANLNGENTTFLGATAIGGGRGHWGDQGVYPDNISPGQLDPLMDGGSGGGSARFFGTPTIYNPAGFYTVVGVNGYGTPGQGHDGGYGVYASGGGGAGGSGVQSFVYLSGCSAPPPYLGKPGPGRASSITGTEVYYGGGGAGGRASFAATCNLGTWGYGGIGGGGGMCGFVSPCDGEANTGGGGGAHGGVGGSGIVIARYLVTEAEYLANTP